MPLPILQQFSHAPTDDDLMRYFHRAQVHWTRHIAQETVLEVGTAFANPQLARVYDANRVLDTFLPEGVSPAQAVELVARHFEEAGTRCSAWVMSPSVPEAQTAPLVEHLLGRGFGRSMCQVMHLDRMPMHVPEVKGLQIIPARASYRHAQAIAEESARQWGAPQLAEASLMHLDDPHWDALLALREGQAVAQVGVLAVGDVGLIDEVFVSERYRRQGIGRTMVGRALEICARSLFKHVLLGVVPENRPAIVLYEQLGFRTVGHVVTYRAPG